MKLYKVTIEMMALGEDEDDARYSAGDADLHACEFEAEEVTTKDGILPGWRDALPWGHGISELTCLEMVERRKA